MITSKQNSLIKAIRSLSEKKFRDALNLYVVENIKTVKEVLDLKLPIKALVGTEKGLNALNHSSENYELVTEEIFKYISNEVSPQGVLAVVEKPQNYLVKPKNSCILLDGVADPANVGAILRTAVASGYNQIYMTEGCADAYSPKAVRSSMSGVFRANVMRGTLSEILSVMELPIVVADMDGENVYDVKINEKFCLVIGNEGRGVSAELKAKAKKIVSIPMLGGMESLNASVSAGILMYTLNTQLKGE